MVTEINKPIVTMKRYELKYILTKEQAEYLTESLKGHMEVDQYGKTSIASIYYDTPNLQLVRHSVEKPPFKEKIRLRSYGLAKEDTTVFLELKRKFDGIVYKRRVPTTISRVESFFLGEGDICADGQIAREIRYFRDYYKLLEPSCLIIYDRVAYRELEGDLRLTIDYNPRYRKKNLNLTTSMDGIPLLPEGSAILEVKVQQAVPLWLSHILSKGKIYKNNFSKYGTAYETDLYQLI